MAIIPDGNRRWARRAGLAIEEGHTRGFLVTAPKLLLHLHSHGVRHTTLWMFSTENWRRDEAEVGHLMHLYDVFLKSLMPSCIDAGIEMRHLGAVHRLPLFLSATVGEVQARTGGLPEGRFYFALDHGTRSDIVALLRRAIVSGLAPEDVDEDAASRLVRQVSHDMPEPDLIVRTSGETRLSGFMPLHCHYSELYFTETLFPDFTCEELDGALAWYGSRQRRFGH